MANPWPRIFAGRWKASQAFKGAGGNAWPVVAYNMLGNAAPSGSPVTLAVTIAADTVAVGATISYSAALAVTGAASITAITASQRVDASLAVTVASDTAAINAAVQYLAALAVTEAASAASMTVGISIAAALAANESPDAAAITAAQTISAALATTLPADIVAFNAGSVVTVSASLASTVAADATAMVATQVITASLAGTVAPDAVSFTAGQSIASSLAVTTAPDVFAGAATVGVYIMSIQDGLFSDPDTWEGGVVPVTGNTAVVQNAVDYDVTLGAGTTILITAGSLAAYNGGTATPAQVAAATVAALATPIAEITAVKAKTDNLPVDPAREATSQAVLGLSV